MERRVLGVSLSDRLYRSKVFEYPMSRKMVDIGTTVATLKCRWARNVARRPRGIGDLERAIEVSVDHKRDGE